MYYNVRRFIWDLERFGMTLDKLLNRCTLHEVPRIVVVSIPKAGTHLIERVLCLHPYLYRRFLPTLHPNNVNKFGGLESILRKTKPGQVIITHLHYSKDYEVLLNVLKVKSIFMIRDPRDVVVSEAFYMKKSKKHPYHSFAKELSLKECLYRSIMGDPNHGYPSINQTLAWFSGWLHSKTFVVRFEDVVDEKKRKNLLRELFEYLEVDLQVNFLEKMYKQVVSPVSPTFRKGRSGAWQKYLKGDLYDLFLENAGQWIDFYGY